MRYQYRKNLIKAFMLFATTNAFFVGTVAQADYQFATGGRTGTIHTGTIYCPANEQIYISAFSKLYIGLSLVASSVYVHIVNT